MMDEAWVIRALELVEGSSGKDRKKMADCYFPSSLSVCGGRMASRVSRKVNKKVLTGRTNG